MSAIKDLTNKKIGKLTIIERQGNAKSGHVLWLCRCNCGNEKLISSNQLRTTKSCGCLQKQMVKEKMCNRQFSKNKKEYHGMQKTRLYRCWQDMKKRCYNPNSKSSKSYMAKNISVCDEWKNSFLNFYNWSINNGYNVNLTIDRIDVYGNYEPSNCRWVDIKTQNNNRRNNKLVEFNNEKMTLKQYADKYSLNYKKLSYYFIKLNDLELASSKAGKQCN